MKKGYWIITFHKINDPAKVEAYRNLAGPVMQNAGAKFIVRGMPEKVHERGVMERVVVIEFESLARAIEVHDGAPYQEALQALGDGAERDLRIVEEAG